MKSKWMKTLNTKKKEKVQQRRIPSAGNHKIGNQQQLHQKRAKLHVKVQQTRFFLSLSSKY